MNTYIGHESQFYGVEEHRLVGGKGDGMRLLLVRNGKGLEFTVSADRAADISRLTFEGVNCGYFSPCGYVAPAYYNGEEFLKSFTAGFMTTCGLNNIGSPCEVNGEKLPLHGTIANIPAENIYHFIENGEIHIKAKIHDTVLFGRKLVLEREYIVPLSENAIYISDKITNIGSETAPIYMLYHFNVGYPLLCEDTELKINADGVIGRNEHANSGIADCLRMEKPQRGYDEMCFFHTIKEETAKISVYNPNLRCGFAMTYDTAKLPYFTEWKMMGETDYVLGVEPSISPLDGGSDTSGSEKLPVYLEPGECKTHTIKFEFFGK